MLLKELGVKPHEAIFVTSRSAIIEQQVTDGLIERFSFNDQWKINLWNTGESGTEPDFELQAMPYSDFIELIDQHSGYRPEILAGIKVFIIDECHALYNDSFIKGIEAMRFVVNRAISETEAIVIGMTATPGILERSKHLINCKLNYLLDAPLFRYRAKNLWIANRNSLTTLLSDKTNFPGKSIVMMQSVKDCKDEMTHHPNSHLQVSRRNKHFDPEIMPHIRRSICYEENFPAYAVNQTGKPQPVDILFTTSTLREGINLGPSSGVKNVIVDFQDDINIIQFLGRCRFNVDNLIILASNHYYSNHKVPQRVLDDMDGDERTTEQTITAAQYRSEQTALFYELWRDGKTDWLKLLENVVCPDLIGNVVPQYYPNVFTDGLFYSWFDERFGCTTDSPEPIYSWDHKREIVQHAISLNLFRVKTTRDITFTSVINHLKEAGLYKVEEGRMYIDKQQRRVKIIRRLRNGTQTETKEETV